MWYLFFKFSESTAEPWYRSVWFSVSYVLLVVMLPFLILCFKSQRLKKKNQGLEREIKARTKELEARILHLEELEQFKRNIQEEIVHDLQNPLNGILNLCDHPPFQEQLSLIREMGASMLVLVDNLMETVLLEETKVALRRESFEVAEILAEVVKGLSFWGPENNYRIRNEIPSGWWTYADKALIRRVLGNLLSNAVKYSPEGGKIQVLCARKNAQRYLISVTDQGPGIAIEDQERIFFRLEQANPQPMGVFNSRGLGLTFCKWAIEEHGCELGVESRPGEGATFWFTLPIFQTPLGLERGEGTGAGSKSPLDFNLSESDRKALAPIALQLSDLPIYRISAIRNLTLKESALVSEPQQKWMETVFLAASFADQPRYQALLNLILHP